MNIYVVTDGNYSGYHIEAIFSTKAAADEYCQTYCSEDDGCVQDWAVDDPSLYGAFPPGLAAWTVEMKEDGTVTYTDKDGKPGDEDLDYQRDDYGKIEWHRRRAVQPSGPCCYKGRVPMPGPWTLFMKVLAKDKEHAIKIVNEKRAQLVAANEWGVGCEQYEF